MSDFPRRYRIESCENDGWHVETVLGHTSHPSSTSRASKLFVPSNNNEESITFRNNGIDMMTSYMQPARPSVGRPRKRNADFSSDKMTEHLTTKRHRSELPYGYLLDDYRKRKTASACFPPRITFADIKKSMRRYEKLIDDACVQVEASCACCGLFTSRAASHTLSIEDYRIVSISSVEEPLLLDTCYSEESLYRFCNECFAAINCKKIPKYSSLNVANVTMCQHYPKELEDLTLTEEYVIARSHPIGSVLKLRPNGTPNPCAYNAIRGHIITIPLNPGPLLDILPSPQLRFHDHIRIIWSGKNEPTVDDLKPFAEVRKHRVIRALLWLCQNNPLYKSVDINYKLLDSWSESFVPSVLQDTVIQISEESDSTERGTYAGDMDRLSENDLQNALHAMGDNKIGSGAVYSDVEGQRLHPELKIISALSGMLNSSENGTSVETEEIPTINWMSRGRLILMNDYDNPEYFTGAFPTLFPFGTGGHIAEDRKEAISLEAWARWLLNHHTRKFARHPIFMYLLYDVLQRRKAAFGNSLLVKRRDYDKIQTVISSLTHERLVCAAESLRSEQRTSDPAIAVLRRMIQVVATHVPNSMGQKREMREYIRALFVEFGPAAFWLTLNPSDLRDPLVLVLAGVGIPSEVLKNSTATAIQKISAIMDPVSVAKFFHAVCNAIFKGLIQPENGETGIFGDVSTYFGVVETNGRGMLHLHSLIWLTGNLDFFNLADKLRYDTSFRDRMIDYLDNLISECLDTCGSEHVPSYPSTIEFDEDQSYMDALHSYCNAIARERQLHSQGHNPTCFKYYKKGEQKCRFSFPRPIVKDSYLDEMGIIHLRRNNGWITPYNPCIAAAIKSNHDLSFLATKAKALSLLYYITNYATKDEASTYQIVTSAAIIKKALEETKQASNSADQDPSLVNKGMTTFGLRVFNRMAHDKEISGVQVASSLLDLPAYYTPRSKLRRINLYYLRLRFPSIVHCFPGDYEVNEEQVSINSTSSARASLFDDYRWRGPSFSHLSLYEYTKIVDHRNGKNRTSKDVDFDIQHPNYGKRTQIFCSPKSLRRTVILTGQLSEHQETEDQIPGGHSNTLAIQNDLAMILLVLFVPWQNLPSLFSNTTIDCNEDADVNHNMMKLCSAIWAKISNSLPDHVQEFARNVHLLRRIKEDAEIDKIQREMFDSTIPSTFIPEVDDYEHITEDFFYQTEGIDNDSLRLSYYLVRQRWNQMDYSIARDIPALQRSCHELENMPSHGFTSIFTDSTSDFCFQNYFSNHTLKTWSNMLKNLHTRLPGNDKDTVAEGGDNNDDSINSEAGNGFEMLQPILHFSTISPDISIDNLLPRVGRNPSCSHLTSLIEEILPLNYKQKRVVSMIFYYFLRLQSTSVTERENQFLLYVAGEGGTGKSRIIDAVRLGTKLLQRQHEVIITAPTGNAAKNVQGSTIHTSLNIGVRRGPNRKSQISKRVRALWRNKSVFIIDEISMVSSKLMDSINKQCNILKNLDSDSTAIFGGLPIVILLGDFHQFPPVRARALWQNQEHNEEKRGHQLWLMFNNVVCLDEQMRQQNDVAYHDLLKRARNNTLTQADVDLLNSRVISELENRSDRINIIIVRTNNLRHLLNRLQLEEYARLHNQKIYILPATLSRFRKLNSSEDIEIDRLFEIQDCSDVRCPGFLLYTKNMPAMILSNICTPLGIVNGAQGRAVDIIPDPNTEICPIDSLYILSTHPPKCVLFEPNFRTNFSFPGLEPNIVPIFPCETSLTVQNTSVNRYQVSMTPAWAITDYKIQGSTCDAVTLDLHRRSHNGKKDSSHKRYCTVNVQLSRVRTIENLFLLQPVTLEDLNNKPDRLLTIEDDRISVLARKTDAAWKEIESTWS